MSPPLTFPPFPLLASDVPVVGLQMPLTCEEDQSINKLKVSNPSITEQETRGQRGHPLWFQIRRHRMTSNNFGQKTISSRKDLSNASATIYAKWIGDLNKV